MVTHSHLLTHVHITQARFHVLHLFYHLGLDRLEPWHEGLADVLLRSLNVVVEVDSDFRQTLIQQFWWVSCLVCSALGAHIIKPLGQVSKLFTQSALHTAEALFQDLHLRGQPDHFRLLHASSSRRRGDCKPFEELGLDRLSTNQLPLVQAVGNNVLVGQLGRGMFSPRLGISTQFYELIEFQVARRGLAGLDVPVLRAAWCSAKLTQLRFHLFREASNLLRELRIQPLSGLHKSC
mmetsp:Transcript_49104/g.130031  ORF Transcript_49104/g.130031 Transcript_49104/m.130031 type:complete len:236 (-) Transcript_49104:593-1300(-)